MPKNPHPIETKYAVEFPLSDDPAITDDSDDPAISDESKIICTEVRDKDEPRSMIPVFSG